MPRCFMAKKLKSNLYQQWKQEQENQRSASGSRSPSPITMMNITHEDHLERSKELASTVASSGVAHTGHDLSHNGGKWCYFVHLVFNSQNGCKPRVIRIQQYTKKNCMGFCVFNVHEACPLLYSLVLHRLFWWRWGEYKWPFKVHE